MDKQLFNELVESLQETKDIIQGKVKPSRVFKIESNKVKDIRNKTGLSQNDFASILHISVRTLQNWEQNQRKPSGAAAALLTVIEKMPKQTLEILQQA
jgi:putative transcriptional regulator